MRPATKVRKVKRSSPDATRSRARKIDTQAMAAARAAALERRRAREDAALVDFREWLRMESQAHQDLTRARDTYGPDAHETREAYGEWRAAMSLFPQLPPDSAFVRERGEIAA